jgi:ribonuclease HI
MSFYDVWVGKKTGIFTSWNECQEQVNKFSGAKFRKLKATNLIDAQKEFDAENLQQSVSISINVEVKKISINSKPNNNVLTVDGAYNGKEMEFQGVWSDGSIAFKSKKYIGGTNNIAEFLALGFAIKYLQKNNLPLEIYSDSITAMAWFRNKKANTSANETGKMTDELQQLIFNMENFLISNIDIPHVSIVKWDTKNWGEIPADFGRK